MNKKIVMSLSIIAAVGAAVVGGTGAFFSDVETSTGNVFTAGAIDLKVDSEQHYNGNVCVPSTDSADPVGAYRWSGNAPYPKAGTVCEGSWEMTDLGLTHKFFNFGDVKPGDEGENTISLHVINNDAYMCAVVSGLANDDLGLTEPEGQVDATDGVGNGELQQNLVVKIWADNSENEEEGGWAKGDNVWQEGEPVLYEGAPQAGTWPLHSPALGAIVGGETSYLGVAWSLPTETGNEVQTDSFKADISFYVEQARNNPNFSCSPRLVTGS